MNFRCLRRELLSQYTEQTQCKKDVPTGSDVGQPSCRPLLPQTENESCGVDRAHGCDDKEQTYVKEVVPTGSDVRQPRRSYSETDGCSVDSAHGCGGEDCGKDNFDFYLAVSDLDLEDFGVPFAKLVEERIGMRACLAARDIDPGGPKFESMAEFLETRCGGKVVFVVSKNFADSEECQFLVHFAKHLDPFATQQKLIPLEIDKDVKIPRVLQGVEPIKYNMAVRQKWLGKRLWEAIHGVQTAGRRRSWSVNRQDF